MARPVAGVTSDPLTYESSDGRTVRVRFGSHSWAVEDARTFAAELLEAVSFADRVPDMHDRHGTLWASCPLCVYEAGSQPDRLTYDDTEGDTDD